jgi:hypothetical protein
LEMASRAITAITIITTLMRTGTTIATDGATDGVASKLFASGDPSRLYFGRATSCARLTPESAVLQ